MLSIIEQERREAVKNYREQMAMFEDDERELRHNRGWNDSKAMLPSKSYGVFCFVIGAISGALTPDILTLLLA